MSWFSDAVATYANPTTPKKPTGSNFSYQTGSGLVAQAAAEVDQARVETEIRQPFATQASVFGNQKVGAGWVPMANPNWYYSAADAYGRANPSDPTYGMWNYALDSKAAGEDAYNDDYIVSPYMKQMLEAYAKTIHFSKTGPGVWEDAVAASMSKSQRGEYVTPLSIVMGWLQEWQTNFRPESDGGSSGYYGGGGGFGGGGGGGQINLMNEEDARAVVNSLASQMLGRTVNEKEFQQYYKSLLSLQKENPSSVSFDDAGNTVVQDPIGSEGLRYNLEEQMRNTEDFVTNSVGTQAIGLLEQYIQSRRVSG